MLQDKVKQDDSAYVKWFEKKNGRTPNPEAAEIATRIASILMNHEKLGGLDAASGLQPLSLEDYAEATNLAETFSGADEKTLSQIAKLLHEFYMEGYGYTR